MTVSIFKDIHQLAQLAFEIAETILQNRPLNLEYFPLRDLSLDKLSTGYVPCRLLNPLAELQGIKYRQIEEIRTQIRNRQEKIILMTGILSAAATGISIIFFLITMGIFKEIKARRSMKRRSRHTAALS